MCSQTVAETSKFTNIWKRFWTPLQIDCGMLVDTGEKDEKGQPILEAKYGFHAYGTPRPVHSIPEMDAQEAPDRHGALVGQMTFDLDDIEADKADMAKIEAAVRAA